MMRHLRLLGLVSIALLALFVAPTVVAAQTPVQDQYEPAPDPDADVDPDADAEDAGDADDVNVQAGDADGKLPFTGGSVPLLLLIGLALLTAGLIGTAATRKRRSSGSS